jgi:hypothetical protein
VIDAGAVVGTLAVAQILAFAQTLPVAIQASVHTRKGDLALMGSKVKTVRVMANICSAHAHRISAH